ncbi:hypothetical protein GP486_000064 [Trichoglossum hirsutum]|uniref:mitogen-activated protein kinase n=1 Tax=Trichoglossum hirsutum TaxID=265104 RepID=A0A9P8RUA5_9PEZI|nr:hypothetical protein GP486_000064 [Trichoglossum hirsutum]
MPELSLFGQVVGDDGKTTGYYHVSYSVWVSIDEDGRVSCVDPLFIQRVVGDDEKTTEYYHINTSVWFSKDGDEKVTRVRPELIDRIAGDDGEVIMEYYHIDFSVWFSIDKDRRVTLLDANAILLPQEQTFKYDEMDIPNPAKRRVQTDPSTRTEIKRRRNAHPERNTRNTAPLPEWVIQSFQDWLLGNNNRFPNEEQMESFAKLIKSPMDELVLHQVIEWFESRPREKALFTDSAYGTRGSMNEPPSIDSKKEDSALEQARQSAPQPGCPSNDYYLRKKTNDRQFQCPYCYQDFKAKESWKRHMSARCNPGSGFVCLMEKTVSSDNGEMCSYCGGPYVEGHACSKGERPHRLCYNKPIDGKIFKTAENFKQHFKFMHSGIRHGDYLEKWRFPLRSRFDGYCGFCRRILKDPETWMAHVGDHFEDGKDMSSWDTSGTEVHQETTTGGDGSSGGASGGGSSSTLGDRWIGKYPGTDSQTLQWGQQTSSGSYRQTSDGYYPKECPSGKSDSLQLTHVKVLGHGAFSSVDRVLSKASGKMYARKIFRRSSHPTQHFQSFQTELKILSQLQHAHVVHVLNSFATGRASTILMEPVADCDLESFMRTHSSLQSEGRVALSKWYGCLVSGLEYIHGCRIRHGDIKPANILVKGTDIFYSDFGAAMALPDAQSTISGHFPNTRVYAAPEVVYKGQHGRPSDIFSLGCVFSEMVTVQVGERLEIFHELRSRKVGEAGIPDSSYYGNLSAIMSWIAKLRGKQSSLLPLLQQVLDSCATMLRDDRLARPTASDLADTFPPGACCEKGVARGQAKSHGPVMSLSNPLFTTELDYSGLALLHLGSFSPLDAWLDYQDTFEKFRCGYHIDSKGMRDYPSAIKQQGARKKLKMMQVLDADSPLGGAQYPPIQVCPRDYDRHAILLLHLGSWDAGARTRDRYATPVVLT